MTERYNMSGSATPSREEIVDALNQSGYLMEQEVATQLEALGYHVKTNRAYEDKDEGKSREIDVQAIKRFAFNPERRISAFIEIIVECKNSSNPLVFIGRPKNQTDNREPPSEYVFPIKTYEAEKKIDNNQSRLQTKNAFFHLGLDKEHYRYKSATQAVQFCRIDRNGKNWHANHGGLYDATFYPMAKALTARKDEIYQNNGDDKCLHLFVPMLVTSGDVFYVDSTAASPDLQLKPYVTFVRELKSKTLTGLFSLDFVGRSHLASFLADCIDPITSRATDLVMNEPDLVLTKKIPWVES